MGKLWTSLEAGLGAAILALLLATAVPAWAAQTVTGDAFASSLPFDLQPTTKRASINLRRPGLQALYRAIEDAYGIRLLFDRDLEEASLNSNFLLEDATLQEALEAAGSISKTFVAPVTEQAGVVAADTAEKRGEYERALLRSFHLDQTITPQQLAEITQAMRTILDLRRVALDSRSHSVTVLGRVRQVSAAEQFVETLEQAPGEVVLEVEILEVNLQRAREMGVLPPQPFRLLFLGGGPQPLRALGGLSALYGVVLPGTIARLRSSHSEARSVQKVLLRASNGQPAEINIGERFPIITGFVTSSFFTGDGSQQPSVSDLSLFPSVQYEDLGVTMKATPYLHAGREVTLQLDLALRNVASQDENGLPTITNRQVTGQVRLEDGETYLVSGILDRTESESVSGFPLLSRIPWIGGLFGSRRTESRETEFLILIQPRVVRAAPAELFASRSIYFGKELLGLPAAPQPAAFPPPAQPGVPGVSIPGLPQPGQEGQVPPGGLPPGTLPPGIFPPGTTLPQGFPQIPPGTLPPELFQPGQQPPQGLPPGVNLPPNLFPPGVVPQGFPQPNQPRPNQP